MPNFADAPPRALSAEELIRWLEQIADDGDLTPIANRAAVKLAADFACGLHSVSLRHEDMAKVLGVGKNTALRALVQLRQAGHLSTNGGRGRRLTYTPALRSEG